jgi:uncharacterized RDD family membrane protein YckC
MCSQLAESLVIDLRMEEPPQTTGAAFSEGAGFGIRAAARVIDLVYGFVLMLIAGLLAGITLALLEQAGVVEPGWENRIEEGKAVDWVLSLLTFVLYHSVTEGMYGASLGKLICRLHVAAEDGRAITLGKAFKRSLAYCWDALFFGLVAYSSMKRSPLNQRYGDHWAKTVVVKSGDVSADSKTGFEIFVLALLMGSVAVVAFGVAVIVIAAR